MNYGLVGLVLIIALALGTGMSAAEQTGIVASTMGVFPPVEAGLTKGEVVLPEQVDTVGGFTTIDAGYPVGGKALYIDYTIAFAGNNSSSMWSYDMIPLEDLENGIAIEIPCGCAAMG